MCVANQFLKKLSWSNLIFALRDVVLLPNGDILPHRYENVLITRTKEKQGFGNRVVSCHSLCIDL